MDSGFDPARFGESASDVFFRVQGAWMARDMGSVRAALTEELHATLQAQCDQLRAQRRINRLENIAVRSVEVTEAWQESGQDFVTVRFLAVVASMLSQALSLEIDTVAMGALNYHMGYCAWKLGDSSEAERYLRVARDQFQSKHPLDADACFLLGTICRERDDAAQASAYYQAVLVGHPDAPIAPLARLGRGMCRVMLRQDDAALTDFDDLVNEISPREMERIRAGAERAFSD